MELDSGSKMGFESEVEIQCRVGLLDFEISEVPNGTFERWIWVLKTQLNLKSEK